MNILLSLLLVLATASFKPVDDRPVTKPPVTDRPPITAGGSSLQTDWVAAGAKCLVHVDVLALKASAIGKAILHEDDPFDLNLDELDDFARESGMDPRTDLISVTMYATSGDLEHDSVILGVTNQQADVALQRLIAIEELDTREIELDGYTAWSFDDGGDRHYVSVQRLRGQRRLVVVAHSHEMLLNALRVVNGEADRLTTGRGSILARRPRAGSIVFVAAGDIAAIPEMQPASEILRLSRSFAIDIREVNDEMQAEATVSADDAEIAGNIAAVVNGMIALGRLVGEQDPDLQPMRRLVRAIDVSTDDNEVSIRFRYDTQDLLQDARQFVD